MDSCINAYMGRMETRLDDLTYEGQQISSMVRITYEMTLSLLYTQVTSDFSSIIIF